MDFILYLKVVEMGFVFIGDNVDDYRVYEGLIIFEC